jgi:hypothetical protein
VFKITRNTLRGFTLSEVLLMAAMNQLEAKRRLLEMGEASRLDGITVRKRLSFSD